MFGYRRAALPKISCQCTGIRGTGPKAIQDRAPRGVSDSPKNVATGLSAMHETCNLLVTYHETQQSVKMFLAIPHDPTLTAVEDQKLGDKDLNGFSVLIDGDIAHLNRRLVRLGSRRNNFDDLALNKQGVPRTCWLWPFDLCPVPHRSSGKWETAGNLDLQILNAEVREERWHQVF